MHQTRCFILRFSAAVFISAAAIHAAIGFTPGDDHTFMNAGSGRVGLDIRSTKQMLRVFLTGNGSLTATVCATFQREANFAYRRFHKVWPLSNVYDF